jgi:hypothetical protein
MDGRLDGESERAVSEFVDRMGAQRALLQVVNSREWHEELFGLSSQAINRWTDSNRMSPDSEVVTLLRSASERLSFLANRSQMQVSEDYRRVSHDVQALTEEIQETLEAGRP